MHRFQSKQNKVSCTGSRLRAGSVRRGPDYGLTSMGWDAETGRVREVCQWAPADEARSNTKDLGLL